MYLIQFKIMGLPWYVPSSDSTSSLSWLFPVPVFRYSNLPDSRNNLADGDVNHFWYIEGQAISIEYEFATAWAAAKIETRTEEHAPAERYRPTHMHTHTHSHGYDWRTSADWRRLWRERGQAASRAARSVVCCVVYNEFVSQLRGEGIYPMTSQALLFLSRGAWSQPCFPQKKVNYGPTIHSSEGLFRNWKKKKKERNSIPPWEHRDLELKMGKGSKEKHK